MVAAIQIENLKFKYDEEDVLKYINLHVPKGSFVSILGPNGSGKTTLLKNICHLLKPYEGQIVISDQLVERFKSKDLAKEMAVVHQGANSEFDFNVEDVVLMGRFPYIKRFQSESKKDVEIATESMKKTATYHLKHKTIKGISGGERQRVMIARALTQEPQILLLDEPISHLDIKYQLEILKLCKSLNEQNELTIITTLHDINLATRFSDYIILMNHGEIVEIGKPFDVMTKNNIKKVYEVDVEIIKMEQFENPIIIPV